MSLPQSGRVALVTGASRGIGYAVAKALASEGAHVVALARTVGGLEDLDDEIKALGGSATLVPADLKDFAALDRLGAALYERWGRLDVLVANAAILGKLTPLGHVDIGLWDEVMAVNVTANWRLVRSLDPLLRRSEAGRALFVTSGAGTSMAAYWGPYAVSKAALDALARTYAAEVATTPVRVNLFNPGPVATRMQRQAYPGADMRRLPTPERVAASMLPLLRADFIQQGATFDYRDGVLRRRNAA